MSKIIFSDKQIKKLEKNIYVKKVSQKAITYTFEFKEKFIVEYRNHRLPRHIFEDAGFDLDIIGIKRIETATSRWKKAFNNDGELGLKDKRKGASGRPLLKKLTSEQEIERLNAKIEFLKMENDFLKKLDKIERGDA